MNRNSPARQACEEFLHQEIRSNEEKDIWPSQNKVARRLLIRGDELEDAYDELYSALTTRDTWKTFLECLLSTAAIWSPEQIKKQREDRKALLEANKHIARHAFALAELLDQRSNLHDQSGFCSETHYSIVGVIDQASQHNGHYRIFLKHKLEALHGQFDLKYWPSLADCMREIATDADHAKVAATDPLTEAATESKRPSIADFARAMEVSMDENRAYGPRSLPAKFRPSDAAMQSLINVALDLPASKMIDAVAVKNARTRRKRLKPRS